MRSREEILERIDVLSRKAEEFRRQALDVKLAHYYQVKNWNRARIYDAMATELKWVLNDEEADKMV